MRRCCRCTTKRKRQGVSRTASADGAGIGFKDHFSGHARSYAAHRPRYPESLFAWLASVCPGHDVAWDCATGNGQAAHSLARYFASVVATDASEEQIASAEPHPKIRFRIAAAEEPGIEAESVDLITVAQALHWFDIDRFFGEAIRALKSGGILAIWSYERCTVSPECDKVIEKIFAETDDYWPAERKLVDDRYRDIEMPLPEVESGPFEMRLDWTSDELSNYMRTWSGTQRYMKSTGNDPVALYEQELIEAWGDGTRDVRWPLTLRICQKAT